MENKEEVVVLDTTLRDGEQAGHSMSPETKLEIAHALADCGVGVIEAGFPCSSRGEEDAVRRIAREVKGSVICALARIKVEDVEPAARAVEDAERPRIHVFASTSDIHIELKLRSTRQAVLDQTGKMVAHARRLIGEVEFSAEDATRTDLSYLVEIVKTAIMAGATIINLPDTVGYANHWSLENILNHLYLEVPELYKVTLSTHCHNDLGLAVSNTLTAVSCGARQIEGCFLGIGERAGNASLEQVIMGIRAFEKTLGVYTRIQTEKIGPLCRMISRRIGYPIPGHQAIVGEWAFLHSSGIHRDGMNKDRRTYEIMEPEMVGWQGTVLQLTSRMGRNGLRKVLDDLEYDGGKLIERVYPIFLELADLKRELTEEDIHMIVQELLDSEEAHREHLFELVSSDYRPRWGSVQVRRNGRVEEAESSGDGPIDAIFKAIRLAVEAHGEDLTALTLSDYNVVKGFGGPEAIGWVVVSLFRGDCRASARSGNPDVVQASAKAYLRAINHILREWRKQ